MWEVAGIFVLGAWLGDWLKDWKSVAVLTIIVVVVEALARRLGK